MFHTLHVVYVHGGGGGAVTLSDVPGGGNIVVKEFKHLWRGMA